MATVYVKFQASGERAGPKDCTSAVPDGTATSIVMSGQYEDKATNLMVLTGVTADIEQWITQNQGKVSRITEAEGDAIGQSMSPADVIRDSTDPDGTETHHISGTFTITSGQTWTSLGYLYLHVGMVDGDGKDPIGIVNNGTDSMAVTITFRATASPTSTVITAVNDSWRVLIRDSDGAIYDVILITFVNGVATFTYKTTNRPAVCTMQESDMEIITLGSDNYKLKLVAEPKFTIYRTLS